MRVRLTHNRVWRGITFPRGTTWPAWFRGDGRMSIEWEGHAIPVVEGDWELVGSPGESTKNFKRLSRAANRADRFNKLFRGK